MGALACVPHRRRRSRPPAGRDLWIKRENWLGQEVRLAGRKFLKDVPHYSDGPWPCPSARRVIWPPPFICRWSHLLILDGSPSRNFWIFIFFANLTVEFFRIHKAAGLVDCGFSCMQIAKSRFGLMVGKRWLLNINCVLTVFSGSSSLEDTSKILSRIRQSWRTAPNFQTCSLP